MAEELAGFAAIVNGETLTRAASETFAGKTVKLGKKYQEASLKLGVGEN